jgi:hypothetical protein
MMEGFSASPGSSDDVCMSHTAPGSIGVSPAPREAAPEYSAARGPAGNPVAAAWALRAIGRRGALMRHAALQTRITAAGAAVDTRRLPLPQQSASALPRAIERHVDDLVRSSITVEN